MQRELVNLVLADLAPMHAIRPDDGGHPPALTLA
ncbi:MAG: hypothetical protein HONBIEJF_03051 [Fimbriimonadaceae bacterium]|nr:hypothetical protein [Fimbriimonadaceae bacterium]